MTRATDPTRKTEAQPDEWGYGEGSTPHYQGQVYDSNGKTVAITYSDEGGIHAAAIVRDHNAGPDLLAALERIETSARAVADITHARGPEADPILAARLSDLWNDTNEARAAAREAKLVLAREVVARRLSSRMNLYEAMKLKTGELRRMLRRADERAATLQPHGPDEGEGTA